MVESAIIVELWNGVRIANFSSPHDFEFDTGEVLPKCSPDRAKSLMLEAVEFVSDGIKGTQDIGLEFRMSESVRLELQKLQNDKGIDIILVPLPVHQASKGEFSKTRVCRVVDRVTKTISSSKFCL